MDSPTGSDEEKLQQTAAQESLFSKKMKIIIILLSLVLIILLLPLASDLGLPLLRPMGLSLLQRLWDAMRFLAMTAAISIGIISTSHSSPSRKGGDPDGSSHNRSLGSQRPSSPRASISTKVKPSFSNMAVSGSGALHNELSRARNEFDLDRLKGKQVVDNEPLAASESDTSAPHLSTEDDWFCGGSDSPSKAVHVRQFQRILDEENDLKPHLRWRRNSASDAWFLATRIDEGVEEEPGVGVYPVDKAKASTESHKKASLYGSAGVDTKQAAHWSPDRATTSRVGNTTIDDHRVEARTGRLASRIVDHNNGKSRRRSSSLDRRPLHKDDSGQGLRQILDLDSNKSRSSRLARSSIKIDQTPALSGHLVTSLEPLEHRLIEMKTVGSHQILQQEDDATIGSHQTVQNKVHAKAFSQIGSTEGHIDSRHGSQKQQHGSKVYLNQNAESQPDLTINPCLMVHVQQVGGPISSNRIPGKQVDANQTKPDGAKALSNESRHVQPHGEVSRGSDQANTMHILEDTMLVDQYSAQHGVLRRGHDQRRGSTELANGQLPKEIKDIGQDDTSMYKRRSSTSKFLLQNSKHSQSDLNLRQLEQKIGSRTQKYAKPGDTARSLAHARGKKSYSCDFGDDFNPDWLFELEPPLPPGFDSEQHHGRSDPKSPGSDEKSKIQLDSESQADPDKSQLVQNLVPWRASVPINISGHDPQRAGGSPPDEGALASSGTSVPSPGEVNRRADEFITKFNTNLLRQRKESLERRRRWGAESSGHAAGQKHYFS